MMKVLDWLEIVGLALGLGTSVHMMLILVLILMWGNVTLWETPIITILELGIAIVCFVGMVVATFRRVLRHD